MKRLRTPTSNSTKSSSTGQSSSTKSFSTLTFFVHVFFPGVPSHFASFLQFLHMLRSLEILELPDTLDLYPSAANIITLQLLDRWASCHQHLLTLPSSPPEQSGTLSRRSHFLSPLTFLLWIMEKLSFSLEILVWPIWIDFVTNVAFQPCVRPMWHPRQFPIYGTVHRGSSEISMSCLGTWSNKTGSLLSGCSQGSQQPVPSANHLKHSMHGEGTGPDEIWAVLSRSVLHTDHGKRSRHVSFFIYHLAKCM